MNNEPAWTEHQDNPNLHRWENIYTNKRLTSIRAIGCTCGAMIDATLLYDLLNVMASENRLTIMEQWCYVESKDEGK